MKLSLKSSWFLLVLVLLSLTLAGCSTTGENENASTRPWNTPTQWESGLPGGLGGAGR